MVNPYISSLMCKVYKLDADLRQARMDGKQELVDFINDAISETEYELMIARYMEVHK